MAYASLGVGQRTSEPVVSPEKISATLGVEYTRHPRLGSAIRKDWGEWAEVDERCPYCMSEGYVLHAQRLGNVTRLEGTCRFCGMHAISMLA